MNAVLTRSLATATSVVIVAGCLNGDLTRSAAPTPGAIASPGAVVSPTLTAAPVPAEVPPGRILFHRSGPDGVERYFTIDTDGANEVALYSRKGCECAHWSGDGTHVLTIDDTGPGTFRFTTMLPDGSDVVAMIPPIDSLNLAPGASTLDGRSIAFNGWDDKVPSNAGLYLGSPDLVDLRRVTPLLEGWNSTEPFGVTPDGSKVVFFADTGPDGDVTHAGDLYVIDADGDGLRRLSPIGTRLGYFNVPVISLSPDGRQAVFGVDDAVWLVDIAGGEARRITTGTGFVWAVSWSPTGGWITYSRFHGKTSVVALVRPDGTDQHEISARDETDEANGSAWSPDGKYLLVTRDSDSTVDGPQDLWIMDLGGTYLGQVTHQPSRYGTYSWAPRSLS